MAISYNAIDVLIPPLRKRETNRWIKEVVASCQKTVGDICYIFCSDEEILRINREYLQHDYYTDIITFDYSEDDRLSGDLFISLETVQSNSEQFETEYINELLRVMIHGVLHLCGFQDKSPADEQAMRQRENEALKLL